jgi:hypothetical protein
MPRAAFVQATNPSNTGVLKLDVFAFANVPRDGAARAKTSDRRIVKLPERLTWLHGATGIPVLLPGSTPRS